MNKKSLENTAIVIPVWNEASVVGSVIASALKHFSTVICVDDGSKDSSADVIVKAGAILVKHPVNLGAGAATQTGIEYALSESKIQYFITIDADGQHDIDDAINMLEYLKKNKLDVVIGSRFLGKTENMSPAKWALLKLAHLFSHSTSGVNISDPHNGLQVYNRHFAENLNITLPGFSHKSEIIQRIHEGGYAYGEYPVTVKYTDYSKAKGQPMLNAINISFELFFHKVSRR